MTRNYNTTMEWKRDVWSNTKLSTVEELQRMFLVCIKDGTEVVVNGQKYISSFRFIKFELTRMLMEEEEINLSHDGRNYSIHECPRYW